MEEIVGTRNNVSED